MIDTIYDLCREGLPIQKIARRVKATHQSVRQAIVNDQPSWLNKINLVELRDLQSARCPPSIIADLFDVTEWQLRAYIIALPELSSDYSVRARKQHHAIPVDLLERIPGSSVVVEKMDNRECLGKCSRCGILEDPGNPIQDDLCLWCRVEGAGWDMLKWHEAGCPDVFEKGETNGTREVVEYFEQLPQEGTKSVARTQSATDRG